MTSRDRLLSTGILTLLLGAALLIWRPTSSAVLYSGYARADSGPLTLEVIVDPPVGHPGDILNVNARVTNRGVQALTPSIVLRLPSGLAADVYALPSGATFNLQENRIDWLPVVPAGSAIALNMEVAVQSADVLNPEQGVLGLLRHQGIEKETIAPVWLGIPPLVGEVISRSQVAVGQPIRLHAEITGPGPLTTVWDLGDGRRLELAEPEVVFPAAGRYNISVDVSNPGGRVSRQIALEVLPVPIASFEPDDDSPSIGQPVTFLNFSGGQHPLNVFWDFGDGTTLVGQQQPSHTFNQGGTYRVRLTVENVFGRSEAVWDVEVGVAPVADMVLTDRTMVGQPLVGQAYSDDSVTRIMWDMGDGRRLEGSTISHYYRRPGDYYVSMTADNGYGQTQVGRWIRVDAGISTLYLPMATYLTGVNLAGLSVESPGGLNLDPAEDSLSEIFVLDVISFPVGTTAPEQLYAYLDAARARFGVPQLAYSYELSAAAQVHAQDKARFPENPHVGTDGTSAAERLLRSGYRGGYAGEATAWGFSDPRLAVEFWINSDAHRPILLNRNTNDVGIGFVEDFASANVWHWTAEFGVSFGAPVNAVLRSQWPLVSHNALDTEITNYSWMWPLPLTAGERFTVYLVSGARLIPVGSSAQPVFGSRYILSVDARSAVRSTTIGPAQSNQYEWIVRLENSLGQVIAESERRSIAFTPDPAIIEATAIPTISIVTATPNAATPTVTATIAPTTEPPSDEPPPVIVTATPQPSPTIEPGVP